MEIFVLEKGHIPHLQVQLRMYPMTFTLLVTRNVPTGTEIGIVKWTKLRDWRKWRDKGDYISLFFFSSS